MRLIVFHSWLQVPDKWRTCAWIASCSVTKTHHVCMGWSWQQECRTCLCQIKDTCVLLSKRLLHEDTITDDLYINISTLIAILIGNQWHCQHRLWGPPCLRTSHVRFVLYYPILNLEYTEHITSDNFSDKPVLIFFVDGMRNVLLIIMLHSGDPWVSLKDLQMNNGSTEVTGYQYQWKRIL